MAEIIELTEEDASDIAFGDHPDYAEIKEISHGSGRWLEYMETIVQRESDGKFFKMKWSKALDEMVELSKTLNPILANLPEVPEGYDGWYRLT